MSKFLLKSKRTKNLDEIQKEGKKFPLQGRIYFRGLDIGVENRKGSVRRGVDNDGEPWETRMFYPYGYIRGTKATDGESLDCYVGPNKESDLVLIVHQVDPETGKYDEDKVMLGFNTFEHARDAYLAHYDDQNFLGTITEMSFEEFKEKIEDARNSGKKITKGIRLNLFKGAKFSKDSGQMGFSFFKAPTDQGDMFEGKTEYENGKQYVWKKSKKNPNVRRRFRVDQNQLEAFKKQNSEDSRQKGSEGKRQEAAKEKKLENDKEKGNIANVKPDKGAGVPSKENNLESQQKHLSEEGQGSTPKEGVQDASFYEVKDGPTIELRKTETGYDIYEENKKTGDILPKELDYLVEAGIYTQIEKQEKKETEEVSSKTDIERTNNIIEKIENRIKEVAEQFEGESKEEVSAFREEIQELQDYVKKYYDIKNKLETDPDYKAPEEVLTEGEEKEFGEGDRRRLETTASGKKRWVDADKDDENEKGKRENDDELKPGDVKDVDGQKMKLNDEYQWMPFDSAQGEEEQEEQEEPQEEQKEPQEEQNVDHIKKIEDFNKKIVDGTVTADEARKQFDYLVNKGEEIKKHLFDYFKSSEKHKRKRNNTIQKLAENSYDYQIEKLGHIGEDNFSYVIDVNDIKGSRNNALKKRLEELTDEKIKAYWDSKNAIKEDILRAIENPQTLEDFKKKLMYKKKLTDQEQERYEHLKAVRKKEQRAEAKKREIPRDTKSLGELNITKTIHTKTEEDLWVVNPKERLERDEWRDFSGTMKAKGGYYSKFKRGFIFKEDPTELLKDIAGTDKVEEANKVDESGANPKTIVKLRDQAEKLYEKGDDILNVDRTVNTQRQARMAGNARANGKYMQAIAGTMRNIADGMEDGTVQLLDGINSKAQIEQLESLLVQAKYRWGRVEDISYNNKMNTPLNREHIKYVEFPTVTLGQHQLKDILKEAPKNPTYRKLEKMWKQQDWESNFVVDVSDFADDVLNLAKRSKGMDDYGVERIHEDIKRVSRLKNLGIDDSEDLRAYLREYYDLRANSKIDSKAEKIEKLERDLIGNKIPGYFDTRGETVNTVVDYADIQPGQKILEPSAGKGNLADEIKKRGHDVDVAEINSSLREILGLKGHNIVEHNFLDFSGDYDRIVMNPPFEKGQDIEHVRHAYENCLKEGGRVVSIMSEGPFFRSDKKSQEFRDWLDEVGGWSEKLPEGSFKGGNDATRHTGVNTRVVIIDKEK